MDEKIISINVYRVDNEEFPYVVRSETRDTLPTVRWAKDIDDALLVMVGLARRLRGLRG